MDSRIPNTGAELEPGGARTGTPSHTGPTCVVLPMLELSQHPEVERIDLIFFHFKSTKGDVHEEQFKKTKKIYFKNVL